MRRGNTGMQHKVLTSLFLGYFLFVMIALGHSSATVVLVTAGQKGIIDVTGNTAMFSQKHMIKLCNALPTEAAAHMRKLGLGGKKLMAHEQEASMGSKNAKIGGETSKFSDKDKDALKKSIGSLQEQKTDEQKKHMTMIVPKALKFTSFIIPRSSISNTKHSQDSNPEPEQQISEEPQGTTQEVQTQNLVEASKEIMNLIHKDYKGVRRRSPINDQEPRN